MRLLEDPQGRLDDIFVNENARHVHPHRFRSALGQQRAVIEYQVRQTPRGAAIAIVTSATIDLRPLHRKIVDALETLGLSEPSLTIEIVVAIPRQASGKLKRFIPNPP